MMFVRTLFCVGTRAECIGEFAGTVFAWRNICWSNLGLAVAYRQGLVKGSRFIPFLVVLFNKFRFFSKLIIFFFLLIRFGSIFFGSVFEVIFVKHLRAK